MKTRTPRRSTPIRTGNGWQGGATDDLTAGLAHHRAGRLAEASARYSKILRRDPRNADALNLTGVIARQRGELAASERLILQAVRENDGVATYFHNLGRTYEMQGRTVEAATCFRRALKLNPEDVESLQHLAGILVERGELVEAVSLGERWVGLRPESADARMVLGSLLESLEQLSESERHLRMAVGHAPENAEAHFRLGCVLFKQKQLAEAAGVLESGLRLRPDDADRWNLLGTTLHQLGLPERARQAYLQALRVQPDFPEALSNLGAQLVDVGKFAEAEPFLRRALQLDSTLMNAACNLANASVRRGEALEAIGYLRKVLEVDPMHVEGLCTLGYTLDVLGDDASAAACFRLALQRDPEFVVARYNQSIHILGAGDLKRGWREYELRWKVRVFGPPPMEFTQPQWAGEELRGQRIYVYSEQGLGDTLQFVRYVPLLVERGAEVVLQVQPPLKNLLRDLHPSVCVVTDVSEVGRFDHHCALMSLAGAFGTELHSIPAGVPYLRVGAEAAAKWAGRIDGAGLRVGLVWSGNPEHTRDRLRSVKFEQIRRLTETAGVTFYSLQKGPAAGQLKECDAGRRVIDLGPELLDFTDTAAVVEQLDLVIAVDTAVAHLAGALGRPVWILVAHAPDWRWLRERTDSPWYPTARLFRQVERGRWDDVLDAVQGGLEGLAAREWEGGGGMAFAGDAQRGEAAHG
jgi:Flp pilus assembly protein TadD